MARNQPLPSLQSLVGKSPAQGAAKTATLPTLSDLVGGGGKGQKFKEAPAKKGGGGFLHTLARDTGAEFVGHLGKDIGSTAVGVFPGLYKAGGAVLKNVEHPLRGQNWSLTKKGHNPSPFEKQVVQPTIKQYKSYYGSNVLSHIYEHPLQPILDALTVASLGGGAAAKAGQVAADVGAISDTSKLARLGERVPLETRSPRNIATGKGPVHRDISSTSPLVKGRQVATAKARSSKALVERRGGEVVQYGKQIQAQATQHALGHLTKYQPYLKATRGLSDKERIALNIRPMDIHPDDLAELWKGTPAEKLIADPQIRALVLNPSKKMRVAEPAARQLSAEGAKLLRGKLKEETAAARPGLTKRQASEVLGRPVKELHGEPYYSPHVLDEPQKNVSPLSASGGGKGFPKKLGALHQNTGYLALSGKMHLRSDILGPEFLRRVKSVKYDEIHNALTRGAVRVTKQELDQHYEGKLPKGYEYMRTKPGQKIPATMRAEGDTHVSLKQLIPNPNDLHDSTLAKEGFSTTDPGAAFQSGGHYYIVPKNMVKAATGEFTRSGDFVNNFVKKPLSVWRAAVLGLRVGFFTNNFVGNSIMYGAKTGGQGALRDLFMAIRESHGDALARKALNSAATPPEVRQSLYKEFFPEQEQGTFGKTQSPSTSALGKASSKGAAVYRETTGALPRLTSAVAETAPRRALIRHYIRHSPEFKNVYSALPKQTRSFENAARQVLEGKGGKEYQRFVSKQVNQALGDYLNLSPFERNVMRNAIPFYSWYKAITTTTYHLAVDTPLRANILGQIGQIGKQWSDQQMGPVPTFMAGGIPLGAGKGGTKKYFSTQGINPYATLEQVGRGTTGDISSLGVNPFLQGALDTYAKATGHKKKVSPLKIAGDTLQQMLLGLPPSRVIHPAKPSKLYPNRNRTSEALGYAGLPIKEYNPRVAAQQKRQGR